MKNTAFILASASPRRRQLFSLISDNFTVQPAEVDEAPFRALSPQKQAMAAARAKAQALDLPKGGVVIGCDTVVALGRRALGKPQNRAEAVEFIGELSNRTHVVYTGVAVRYGDKIECFCDATRVTFYPIERAEVESYADTSEPYDKAGGYGIQGAAALWVKKISGCYYNVMGLPVARIAKTLKTMGLL